MPEERNPVLDHDTVYKAEIGRKFGLGEVSAKQVGMRDSHAGVTIFCRRGPGSFSKEKAISP